MFLQNYLKKIYIYKYLPDKTLIYCFLCFTTQKIYRQMEAINKSLMSIRGLCNLSFGSLHYTEFTP